LIEEVFMHQLIRARWVLAFACLVTLLTGVAAARQGQAAGGNAEAAKIKNPVASSEASIAAGKKTYGEFCAGCHGPSGAGGMLVSITEDRGLPPPPDLIDDKWDHGGTDGEVYTTVKNGVPPDYIMGPFDGRLPDTDIWNIINFLRSQSQKK
jgi:mono/diheme cytochrome c family protein